MENRFNINVNDPMPLYAQLERAIRHAIATEKLRVGEQLPTVRQLAIELRVNANTVAKVYLVLERNWCAWPLAGTLKWRVIECLIMLICGIERRNLVSQIYSSA